MVKKTGKTRTATKEPENPLYAPRTKNYRIGGDIQPKGNLYRFVRWPRYIQLQRRRRILLTRLKVPPPINQFRKTLDSAQASAVFRLLMKYRPETRQAKTERLRKESQEQTQKSKPYTLKYGLKHITTLVENKKAKLVVIAHDVDPIELVVWLPALCRAMEVPYCIVKGKSRLGKLTHKKTCTAVALTEVRKEDVQDLELISRNAKAQFTESADLNKWGDGVLGLKSQHKKERKEKRAAEELAKKVGF
jgi:large subunit ribosomal protein L7Ae